VVGASAGGAWLLVGDGGADSTSADYPWALDELGRGESAPGVEGQLVLGPLELSGEGMIGPAGGEVTAPGGLRIMVPEGTHQEETAYTVGRREVLGSSYPDWMRPASAVYVVDNGGAAAFRPIKVEMPAATEQGFAMGFIYDEATGALEALPLLDVAEGSVTVATAHFSSMVVVHLPDWGPGRPALATVDTGFRPGRDDWQFVNRGAYITPGGNCGGQSMSAMWYFVEQTQRGAPPLHGLHDNNGALPTPARWEDDSQAYRLVSSVQQDLIQGWSDPVIQSYASLASSTTDGVQYTAFMAAMAITGHPQFAYIRDTQATGAAHAMIVYRGDSSGLQVADPNYPGGLRTIPWDANAGALGPFDSAAYAGGPGTTFDEVGFIALTALVNWPAIADRWAEFGAQQAGDGRFPDYRLLAFDGKSWVPLEAIAAPAGRTFSVTVQSPGTRWRLTLFTPSGSVLGGEGQPVGVDFPSGTTEVGVLVEGVAPGHNHWSYIDFVDVTVSVGGAPTSDPSISTVAARTELSVHAHPIWGTTGHVGMALPVLVSVHNDGPDPAQGVSITAGRASDCERSCATLPVGRQEYVCLVPVTGRCQRNCTDPDPNKWVMGEGPPEAHLFSVSGHTGFGPASTQGMTLTLYSAEAGDTTWPPPSHAVVIEFDPATSPGYAGPGFARHPVPLLQRVGVGRASTVDMIISNSFPDDYGVQQPGETLVLHVTALYRADDPPQGMPVGWAIRCSGPDLVDEWEDGHAFLLELSAGRSTKVSCTVPGVDGLGVTEYRVEVSTWSGYHVAVPSLNWFVEVAP